MTSAVNRSTFLTADPFARAGNVFEVFDSYFLDLIIHTA